MLINYVPVEITPGVQGLPCEAQVLARQALHSSITFNHTPLAPKLSLGE